jgi:uncharacterized membrane protein
MKKGGFGLYFWLVILFSVISVVFSLTGHRHINLVFAVLTGIFWIVQVVYSIKNK